MKEIKKVVGVNLLAIVLLTLFINLEATGSERELEVALLMLMAVGIQVTINLVVSLYFFIKGDSGYGKSFMVSTAVVLVIGFSACLGSITI